MENNPEPAPSSSSAAAAAVPAPPRPALVILDTATVDLRVGALSLLDRVLVAVHRAGFGPITVVAEVSLPPIPRARAWAIPFEVMSDPTRVSSLDGAMLVVRTRVLVQVGALRGWSGEGRRLASGDGTLLPVGWVPEGEGSPEARLASVPAAPAPGLACRVSDWAEARQAEQKLWDSLTSSSDGVVDRWFNRPVGRPLSRLLIRTPVTPNQISIAATLLGLAAAGMFAVGRPAWSVWAAIVFQFSAILDCIDGDVARVVFKESALGKWLDIVGDQVVHVSVFVGIALGLMQAGRGDHVGWLGGLAAFGAVASFLVVLRGMRRPGLDASGRLRKWLDAATNRDFSVLVLGLAIVDWLEGFLWLAAIGSQVFWMALLAAQGCGSRRSAGPGA